MTSSPPLGSIPRLYDRQHGVKSQTITVILHRFCVPLCHNWQQLAQLVTLAGPYKPFTLTWPMIARSLSLGNRWI